jgi:hypothetical protein
VECDPEKLRAKIAEAESVIFGRLQAIGRDGSRKRGTKRLARCLEYLAHAEKGGLEISRLEAMRIMQSSAVRGPC